MNLRERAAHVVSVADPSQVVSVVPHLVGFQPEASLVAVCLHGPRRRSGMVIRVDLPEPASDVAVAKELADRVEFAGADGVLLVCYIDEAGGDETGGDEASEEPRADALPRWALVEALLDEFSVRPITVADALLVRRGRWWSYTCCGPCCPADGTPIPDRGSGLAAEVGARLAARGWQTLDSRSQLADSVRGPTSLDDRRRRVFDRTAQAMAAERRAHGAKRVREQTVRVVQEAWRRRLGGDHQLTDDEIARISLGLADKRARDRVAALAAAGEPDSGCPESNGDWPSGHVGAWLSLLTEVASRTPDGVAAPVCTTLAWVAYQHGEGGLVNVALDRALAEDPGYEMARLLRAALYRQVPPTAIRSISRKARDQADTRRRVG